MDNKIALRKEAVRRSLSGESQVRIGRALGRSAYWVRYWLTRYNPDDPDGSLQDRSRAPHQPHSHWTAATRQQALTSRQERQSGGRPGYEHALRGAEAIHYELAHLGLKPTPPPRTIHYWLKQGGLVSARQPASVRPSSKPYPCPPCGQVNDLQQLDLKGPLYLHDSAQKHYLLVVRDVCSRGVGLAVAQDRRAATIAAFLVAAWQTRGLPTVLQMDNGLEFRGSNRYPRAFGLVVRLALDVGVEPLFIPPTMAQRWRGALQRPNATPAARPLCLRLDRCPVRWGCCTSVGRQHHPSPARSQWSDAGRIHQRLFAPLPGCRLWRPATRSSIGKGLGVLHPPGSSWRTGHSLCS